MDSEPSKTRTDRTPFNPMEGEDMLKKIVEYNVEAKPQRCGRK